MSEKTIKFGILACGITVGALVAWKIINKKQNMITENDDDNNLSVSEEEDIIISEEEVSDKISSNDYSKMVKNMGYTSTDKDLEEDDIRPYVISPEEFGTLDDYETISLTYYSDGILADDNDDIVDIEEIVGSDSLTRFGEFEDDSVFVRNELLKCDYEILIDDRTYSDVLETKPRRK